MADLHIGAESPTESERSAVASVLPPGQDAVIVETERFVRGGDTRRRGLRDRLLPVLHALQNEIGWISPGGLNHVCERLGVAPAEAHGVATFYELLRTEDPGHTGGVVHVCVDAACQLAGADELITRLGGTSTAVRASPCLGQCERAPARFVQGCGGPDQVPDDSESPPLPQAGNADLILTRRIARVDPTSLDEYRAHGGYRSLSRAMELGADAAIELVSDSGLSGRGGAAFPTGVKWRAVADQTRAHKHVVANADESEPGTFKDRVLMEHDPFALIESLTIAGFATGASHGWIYLRGEYPRAAERLGNAIEHARTAGLLGERIGGTPFTFDIELRRGAGAYICGEETALFNSIEGFRGEPREKPPYPTTHGLFGEPTAVNNPETLVNVLDIIDRGPASHRERGTDRSPGTKLFCLSGSIRRPGVYEVDFGTTLGALLDLAGGVRGDLRAVLLGGAAGSFIGPAQLDLPLTLEDTRAAGATIGSGAVVVFDTGADMAAVVTRIARFFRDESCGQCVPCRIGTVRQHEVLVQIRDEGRSDGEAILADLAGVMNDSSICGLGHTASSAVQSAMRLGLIEGRS